MTMRGARAPRFFLVGTDVMSKMPALLSALRWRAAARRQLACQNCYAFWGKLAACAGVGGGVGEVGQQVAEQRERRACGEQGHEDGIVAHQHRRVEQLAHAGQREEAFEDHAAADQAHGQGPPTTLFPAFSSMPICTVYHCVPCRSAAFFL